MKRTILEKAGPEREAPLNPPPVGVAFLLSQAGAQAAMGFGERLAALDLKPHDAGILRMLGSNPGLSQQSLSGLLGMFPSQLVALLDRLEEHRLIERRSRPADRRSYGLYLTRSGRKALNEIGRLTLELERELFAALSEREKDTLQGFLRRIVAQQGVTPGVHPAYRQIGRRNAGT
jgi:DNA-binding MarR family transcriptional regulator